MRNDGTERTTLSEDKGAQELKRQAGDSPFSGHVSLDASTLPLRAAKKLLIAHIAYKKEITAHLQTTTTTTMVLLFLCVARMVIRD